MNNQVHVKPVLGASEEKLISRKELARRLGVSTRTVQARTREGTIPHIKLGRRCLYRWSTVIAALEAKSAN